MKAKLYVGCSLTHAPKAFREDVAVFKNSLKTTYDVLEFVGLEAGTPADVYRHDTECVRSCDLFIALCDFPSIGLGYELGLATELGKPVIAAAHRDAKVTRLVLGIQNPNYTFLRYNSFEEIAVEIKRRQP